MTKVVNLYKEDHDIYIGRPRGGGDPRQVPPGAYGFLGNPFPLGKDQREESIAKFENYFLERVASNPAFRQAVENCRGKTLGCFCKPKSCHGDVIARWLDEN